MTYNGRLKWYAVDVGVVVNDSGLPLSGDSAAPGAGKDGFGLRSPYLPGVRPFSAEPTYQACCSKPNDRGEYPVPSEFPLRGFTVAPTVRPQDMTMLVLIGDLQQACGSLHWVTDTSLCGHLRSALEGASAAFKRGEGQSGKEALRAWLGELAMEHGSGKPVSDNAYWLLKVNGEYLLARM